MVKNFKMGSGASHYLSKSESLATEKALEACALVGSVLDMNDWIWFDSLSGAAMTSSFSLTVVSPSLFVTRVGSRGVVALAAAAAAVAA